MALRLKLLLTFAALLCLSTSLRTQESVRVTRLERRVGAMHRSTIGASETRSFSLALKAGEFAQLTIDQQGMDLAVSISDPNRRIVHRADWRWSGIESVSWTANFTGSYEVRVTARRPAGVAGQLLLNVTEW